MFISSQVESYRHRIDEIAKDLHHLTLRIGHAELTQTISDLRNRIHEPFMFVIVGEVKSGKSSFINALLATGQEICKVAPQPMTDTIQQILWGEKEETIIINEYLKKVLLPADILKEIAIVDTPGTNTIIAHHQEITERFIPATDLIVFVFEAKNPYRQSAWDLFDYIHTDWRKKIIFVLQQKDLMEENDLQVNIDGVMAQAQKKGLASPKVFAVSAKEESEGKFESSGYLAIRDYIKANITGGKAPLLKVINNVDICANINERIYKGLMLRKEQWEIDRNFRNDIAETLAQQERKSNKEVEMLVENLLAGYDRSTRETEDALREGLAIPTLLKRSFASLFSSGASAKDWLESLKKGLEMSLDKSLRERLQSSVNDLAESIQQMAKIIDLKLKNSKTILRDNHEIFSDIADRRSNVLRDLQDTFTRFISRSENFEDESLFPQKTNITPNIVSGSGLAIIGIVLAAVTHTSILDITGGLLTAVGLLFAGVTIAINRKKIMKGYAAEIERGRKALEIELTEKLQQYVRHIRQRIENNFTGLDALLQSEAIEIEQLESNHATLRDRLGAIKVEIESMQ